MKIAIDASRANRKQKTGVEWYSYNLIFEFAKILPKDYQVILYFSDQPLPEFLNLPRNFKLKILKWPIIFLWTHIRLSMQILIDRPDVLFIQSHVIPIIHPKKTYTTIHDVAFKKFPDLYSKKEAKYQDFAVKFALKNAKKIFVPSEFTKNEILKYYIPKNDNIIIIHNGFMQQIVKHGKNCMDILSKYNISKPYFLYIGRLEQKKNIIGIIKSFEIFQNKNMKNFQLILAGKQGYNYNEIKKTIENSNLKSQIIELGWTAQEDIPCLLKNCEIFLYPTFYEGFGIPILEAFDSNIPVITSNFGAAKEIAEDAAILADPNNHQEIADYMQKIINNEVFKNSLIIKGKLKKSQFSWDKCARKILKEIL